MFLVFIRNTNAIITHLQNQFSIFCKLSILIFRPFRLKILLHLTPGWLKYFLAGIYPP